MRVFPYLPKLLPLFLSLFYAQLHNKPNTQERLPSMSLPFPNLCLPCGVGQSWFLFTWGCFIIFPSLAKTWGHESLYGNFQGLMNCLLSLLWITNLLIIIRISSGLWLKVGWGHGTWDARTWNTGMPGHQDSETLGDSRTWEVWTWGHDKQTAPEFCAGFVIYNFRWSRGKYYMLES